MPIPLEELLARLESRHAQPADVHAWRISAATFAAALLAGLAVGWQWFGMRMVAASIIDPLPTTTTLLAVVALAAASTGPRIPIRVLPWIAGVIEQRRREPSSRVGAAIRASWIDRLFYQRDETLFWAAAAILSAAAGLGLLLTLSAIAIAAAIYDWLLQRFFWTDISLALLEAAGTALLTAPLWVLHSFVATAMMLAAARRIELRRTVTLFLSAWSIGFGLAGMSHDLLADQGLSADRQIMLGLAPLLVLAALLAGVAHMTLPQPQRNSGHPDARPESGDADNRWIRLALPAWAAGLALAGVGWTACQHPQGPALRWIGGPGIVIAAVSLAAGMLLAHRRTQHAVPGGPGCGMAVWAVGVGAGIAGTLAAYTSSSWHVALQLAALALPAGYALDLIQAAWSSREFWRGHALARLAPAILGGLACALIPGRWILLPAIGPVGLIAAGALLMLTFGGLAQIYSDEPASRRVHLRLGMIFASLAGAITVFPDAAKFWGSIAHAGAVLPAHVNAEWLAQNSPRGARRFCLIGADTGASRHPPASWELPRMVSLSFTFPPGSSGITPGSRDRRLDFDNACKALRLVPGEYDLIYQYGPLANSGDRQAGYSLEWLSALARRRAPGGRVLLDVPIADLGAASTRIVAETFETAMGGRCLVSIQQTGNRTVYRFRYDGPEFRAVAPDAAEKWVPVPPSADNARIRVHSLRRDGLTQAQREATAKPSFLLPATRPVAH